MTVKQLVSMGATYAGISNSELARRLGWSPQLLDSRLKVGRFSLDDWNAIAEALGAKFKIGLEFPDGKEIQ